MSRLHFFFRFQPYLLKKVSCHTYCTLAMAKGKRFFYLVLPLAHLRCDWKVSLVPLFKVFFLFRKKNMNTCVGNYDRFCAPVSFSPPALLFLMIGSQSLLCQFSPLRFLPLLLLLFHSCCVRAFLVHAVERRRCEPFAKKDMTGKFGLGLL